MVVVSEVVHPSSMDFRNQRKVVMLRTVKKMIWADIGKEVVNLRGGRPSEKQCRQVFRDFSMKLGRRVYKYKKCGRKKWKVTPQVQKFIIQRLLALRLKCICTSATLQGELVKAKGVELECSTIRKILSKHGYHWMRRFQKPKYSQTDMALREAFAKKALRIPKKHWTKRISMSMDGVVFSLPPSDPTERWNFCKIGETHMWRKKDESAKPELAGRKDYDKQLPYNRAVPMWGGIGRSGFGVITFHEHRKLNNEEWAEAVSKGHLVQACRDACEPQRYGPWVVLCDNESFLEAPASRKAHAKANVELWHVPPRSPDLNPVEVFWAWARRRLRAMDLKDLHAKRPPLQKIAMKARVRALMRTRAAKRVASRCFMKFRRTCQECKDNGGAATK